MFLKPLSSDIEAIEVVLLQYQHSCLQKSEFLSGLFKILQYWMCLVYIVVKSARNSLCFQIVT